MTGVDAIIFDFDGVLLESEFQANTEIARLLTELGHPHTTADAIKHFTGLNGRDFVDAVETRIGASLPTAFGARMKEKSVAALREGIEPVAGAVTFIRTLPADLPKAVASSSSTEWIATHLGHIGLADQFGAHIYSGREHVDRGKPAPDLYLYAARKLGVEIGRTVIIEDSRVGIKGAVASGARVIGLAAGEHCFDGHDEMLLAEGASEVVHSFDQLRRTLALA